MSARRAFWTTFVVWTGVVVLTEGARISRVLNGPPSPELYTNNLTFQLFSSGLLIWTQWAPLLVLILAIEAGALWVFRHRRR